MKTKKRIFLLAFSLLLLSSTTTLNAQVTIGAETAPADYSLLELNTTNVKGGLRLPQLTTAEKESLTTKLNALTDDDEKQAAKGLVIYNTDTGCTYTWNGVNWISNCASTVPNQSCGAYINGGVWLEFMCHNLGANENLDPFTPAAGLHGGKYKWGAANSGISMGRDQSSSSTVPNWKSMGTAGATTADWDMTTQNPCPAGWRVPTKTQWTQILANNTVTYIGVWTSSRTNFTSGIMIGEKLFLPAAGLLEVARVLKAARGAIGMYWASDRNGTAPAYLQFEENTANGSASGYGNNNGFSIRCVAL